MSSIRPTDVSGGAAHARVARSRARSGAPGRIGRSGGQQQDEHHVPRESHRGKLPPMHITFYDGSRSGRFGQPLLRPMSKAGAEARDQAAAAEAHLRRIDGMLRERWNRAGWDDRGGDLTVIVNQVAMGGNAYFMQLPNGSGQMGIGTKDRTIGFRRSPAHSPSILFHELVHGIVGSEVQGLPAKVQPYLTMRDFSAVNESVADVISTGMLKTDWRNGQEIRGGAPLRDLADPSIPKWTPAVRRDTGLEEHSLSGIMSRAAVLAADKVGTGPVVDAWYAAVDRHFRSELLRAPEPGAGRAIGAWVRATMRGAEQVGGANSDLVKAVRKAWKKVGLGVYAEQVEQRRGAPPVAPR